MARPYHCPIVRIVPALLVPKRRKTTTARRMIQSTSLKSAI
jgi:hypothetical protein